MNRLKTTLLIASIVLIIVIGGIVALITFGCEDDWCFIFPWQKVLQTNSFEECADAGYPVGESYPRQCWTPEGKHFVEKIEQSPPLASGPITISGEITCLPKKSAGAQTMECAIGLKGLDGRHYGLKNLSKHDPEYKFSATGLRVEVVGVFSPEEIKGPDGNVYDVVGVIDITSIKEVKQVSDGGCKITGCSNQICSDQDVITTCEFRPEYACYKDAKCERQSDNRCGWTTTSELSRCLQSSIEQ